MRWPYLRMNYPNPKDLKVPKALKDSIKPSSQTLNKKQKAVITTAFLFFNLKSNTMKTQCKYSNYVFKTSGEEKSSAKNPV